MRWPRLFLLLGNPDDHTVQAGSLFSVAGGVWAFRQCWDFCKGKFQKGNGVTAQYSGPVGPDTVAKR